MTTLGVGTGDRLLLCSDGLSDVVAEKGIERPPAGSADPAHLAHRLIAAGLEARASDNVTVVVADVIERRWCPAVAPVPVGAAAQPAAEVVQALETLWPDVHIRGLPVVRLAGR